MATIMTWVRTLGKANQAQFKEMWRTCKENHGVITGQVHVMSADGSFMVTKLYGKKGGIKKAGCSTEVGKLIA